jgi:hypothetical protein
MQLLIDQITRVPDCTELECGNTLFVHLCDGQIVEISPTTAVRVTDESVEALDGRKVVAVFPRTDVYLAADIPMEPPSME